MAIQDPAMGFVPKTRVPHYQVVDVSATLASKIYKFMPVVITGGYAVPAAITGDVAGIAMEHRDVTPGEIVDLPIISDSSVVFEVNGDVAAVQADIGYFVSMKTANGGTNDFCTTTVDVTNAVAVATADTPFQIVGFSKVVTNASTTLKVRVKLAKPFFDGGFPVA